MKVGRIESRGPLPWPNWLRRWRLVRRLLPYTLVGPKRLRSLYELSRRLERERVPGDVVECGVYNGGTAAILAHFATRSPTERTLWLFDSFEGMPQGTAEDGLASHEYVGKVVGEESKVREALALAEADQTRVRIIKGWFHESFSTVTIPRVALLNIDADWHDSVKLCLEKFYDKVVPGGYISIDDYGHWPGCRKAVDEFFESRRLGYVLHAVDYTARWFRKD